MNFTCLCTVHRVQLVHNFLCMQFSLCSFVHSPLHVEMSAARETNNNNKKKTHNKIPIGMCLQQKSHRWGIRHCLYIYFIVRFVLFKIISFTTAFCTVVFIFVVAVVYLFCFFTFHFFFHFISEVWNFSTMVKANRTTCVMCWICTSVAVFLFVSFMTRCLFIAVKTMI